MTMQHQSTTDRCAMMMVPHLTKLFMDGAHVASGLSSDNVYAVMYQNAYEPNLIFDSELVCFLVIHKDPTKHLLALAMVTVATQTTPATSATLATLATLAAVATCHLQLIIW